MTDGPLLRLMHPTAIAGLQAALLIRVVTYISDPLLKDCSELTRFKGNCKKKLKDSEAPSHAAVGLIGWRQSCLAQDLNSTCGGGGRDRPCPPKTPPLHGRNGDIVGVKDTQSRAGSPAVAGDERSLKPSPEFGCRSECHPFAPCAASDQPPGTNSPTRCHTRKPP